MIAGIAIVLQCVPHDHIGDFVLKGVDERTLYIWFGSHRQRISDSSTAHVLQNDAMMAQSG